MKREPGKPGKTEWDWHQGQSRTWSLTKYQAVQFALWCQASGKWCAISETRSWSWTCRFMTWLSVFFASCSCRRLSCDKPLLLMAFWLVSYLHSGLVSPPASTGLQPGVLGKVERTSCFDPGNPRCDITWHHILLVTVQKPRLPLSFCPLHWFII